MKRGLSNPMSATDEVELRIGANLTNLPIIRSLAASIAMRADFDLDAIADLKLAVDEACSTLIVRAAPDSALRCCFTVGADAIRFTVTVPAASGEAPDTTSFGWQVLTTLTDDASAWVEGNGQAGSHAAHIEWTKRRVAG
jgi:serine/threonine-protein kinase RsbW